MKNFNFKNLTPEQKNNLFLVFLGLLIIIFVFIMPNIYDITHKNEIDYTNTSNNTNKQNSKNNQNNTITNPNNGNTDLNDEGNNNETNEDTDTTNETSINNEPTNDNIPKSYVCVEEASNITMDTTISKKYIIENKVLKEVKTTTTKKYKDATLYDIEKQIYNGSNNDDAKTITIEETNDYITERVTNYEMPEGYKELREYLINKGKNCTVRY